MQGSNTVQNPEEMMTMVVLLADVRNHEQRHPFGCHLQLFGVRTISWGVGVRGRPSELSAVDAGIWASAWGGWKGVPSMCSEEKPRIWALSDGGKSCQKGKQLRVKRQMFLVDD